MTSTQHHNKSIMTSTHHNQIFYDHCTSSQSRLLRPLNNITAASLTYDQQHKQGYLACELSPLNDITAASLTYDQQHKQGYLTCDLSPLHCVTLPPLLIMKHLQSANLWYTPELGALYRKTNQTKTKSIQTRTLPEKKKEKHINHSCPNLLTNTEKSHIVFVSAGYTPYHDDHISPVLLFSSCWPVCSVYIFTQYYYTSNTYMYMISTHSV